MKKLIALLLAVALVGCTTHTEHGKCVGINDRDPAKEYVVSIWNVFVGVLFIETLVVPVVMVADQFYCPIGKKP